MAITSVARKATVKKDETILKTVQLVNRQKAVSAKLKLDADKLNFEKGKEARKETAANLKRLDEIGAPTADIHRKEHDKQMEALNDMLSDPSLTSDEKDKAISEAGQYAKSANSIATGIKNYTNTLAGDQEKRKLRNEDGIAQIGAEYLTNEDGTAKPLKTVDIVELQEIIDNDIRSYNLAGSTQNYLDTVQDTVATETSAENMNGLAVKVETTTQSADFAVLDGAGNIEMNDLGEPTVVISNASLAAFKKNKGHQLAMTAAIEADSSLTPKGAMEKVLRDQGHLTVKKETEVKTLAAKTVSEGDKSRGRRLIEISNRVDFIEDDVATGGNQMIEVIKLGRGVVDSATVKDSKGDDVTHTTGVDDIPGGGGKRFTVVIEPGGREDIPLVYTDESGNKTVIPFKSDKTGKLKIMTVDVLDDNPKPGILRLSGMYNATVPTKDRVDHVKFAEAYDKKHAKDNPFGEGGFGGDDGGFGFKKN